MLSERFLILFESDVSLCRLKPIPLVHNSSATAIQMYALVIQYFMCIFLEIIIRTFNPWSYLILL